MTDAKKNTPARPLFAFELIAFALVFWADSAGYIPLSKTPVLFLIAWASLRLRGQNWRTAGFSFDRRWLGLLLIGVVAGAAFWSLEFFIENPALYKLTGAYPDLHDFDDLVGNLAFLAIILVLNLILAALGEELVWRGYALPRIAEIFGSSIWAWVFALFAVNAAFGLAHLYQGEAGIIQTTIQGLLLGVLFLVTGRNLLAPIAAHFTANTCDFVTMYLGLYPGVGA